ncbi:hypothetical protein [Massilia sp. METH4]|uniref:hypothetical protein n=1 Tax=Massilia sp. METH4 TaxID=3123041 RepID=UPI0030D225A1
MEALSSRPTATPVRLPLPYWLRDFALIRAAVTTFVITGAIGCACVAASYLELDQSRRDEQQARGQRDAARARFLYAESEKQEIRVYQPLFVELRQRHFVGAENRLDWVDAIRQIQERRRLLPLTYEVEPQQPYRIEGRLATGDYQLRGSRMSIHMDLLHELDLFNFLGDLRQHGVFTVQECSIRRVASGAGAPGANLSADCVLNWLTLTPDPRRGRVAR